MLTLCISTSFSHFTLVLGENNNVLFNSRNFKTLDTNRIETIMLYGLETVKRSVNEIGKIIVDNGPGGTSSVRTGVAFANTIGYCLNIDVIPVSSFTILGIDIFQQFSLPVLLSAKSIKGNFFWGYFDDQQLKSLLFGTADQILPKMLEDTKELIVTGKNRDLVKNLLPNISVFESDQKLGNVEILIKDKEMLFSKPMKFPNLVMPITENNLTYG